MGWRGYWKSKGHNAKALCESKSAIDSFDLLKTKGLSGFTITNEKYGKAVAVLKEDRFEITNSQGTYSISIDKLPCHFGGYRYFFRCPNKKCNRRMRKLYYIQGFHLCRKCMNLGYYTQTLYPDLRYYIMQERIEKKLEKFGGSIHTKPKWMRRFTFEKLRDRYHEYEMNALEAEIKLMMQWEALLEKTPRKIIT